MSDLHTVSAAMPATQAARDETLHRTERVWLFRRHLPDAGGSFLCKQPLGPDAPQRLRYELGILHRLAGIEGVPQLSAHPVPDTMIAIEEHAHEVPLAQALRNTPRDLPALLPFALTLTRILVAIHRAGVFHRNINPDNILLSGPQRQPMLINFNLATCVAEEQPAFVHHNEILGKLAYLAPEQTGRTGRTVDQRADLYALGVTFYELATGHPPFAAADQLQLVHQLLTQIPTAPIELNPRLPSTLSNIIMRLLEKEPDRRYQSALGLAHDLSRLQDALVQGDSAVFELGARDFASQLSLPSRLIGRDSEIAALRLAFDQALIGQRRGVLISGAPGVGKSSLINTLQPYVTAQRGWVVYGKFDQFRQDLETDAVGQTMRALGRLLLAEPEHELTAQKERILQALDANAARMVAEMPEFALLLGIAPKNASADPLKGTMQLLQATVDLLRAIVSPARPLVMVLDDLQWAASTPSSLLNMLLMDTTLNGLLIVATYRDDAELNAAHPLSTLLARWQSLSMPPLCLRLQNLPAADLGVLLMEMLRLPPAQAEELATMVLERTGGNPYDTLELINALRRDGVLLLGETGWEWDAATIRRFVVQGEVGDLLVARLRRLPAQTQALMQVMACLSGETGMDLLQTASGLPELVLEQQLVSALEDGVLVMNQANGAVSFRHDRVQQAAYDSIDAAKRTELHLQLARRMSTGFAHLAAEQYLQALDLVRDPDESRHVVSLFRNAAAYLPMINFVHAERFLSAAIALLSSIKTAADEALLTTLNIDRHRALFNLGRFEEADGVYRLIEQNCREPLQLVDSACLQISSLHNRDWVREAVTFGFDVLKKLGAEMPRADAQADLEQRIDNLCRWAHQDNLAGELQRPEASNVLALASAKLINRLMASVNSTFDLDNLTWLVLESQRLWTEHGPNPALVGPLSHAAFITIATRQDYRSGYAAVQYLLTLIEPRGYEPATSQARFLFAFSASPWSEPLADTVRQLQRAREGLLRSGDMQNACFSYLPTLTTQLDCVPTLENCVTEIEAAFALAAKSGNEMATRPFFANRQLVRALRGETNAPGSFTDISFDETTYLEGMRQDQFAACFFHLSRGLGAAVFGDAAALIRHAAAAMSLLPRIQSMYGSSLGYLLQALALAERIKHARPEQNALLAELDVCRNWLALRAVDCPINFLHLHQWVEAERAWAIDDFQSATGAFDAALQAVEPQQRPWHRALITERAALFHFAQGLQHLGRMLMTEARRSYEIWGASGKVRELDKTHEFLRAVPHSPQPQNPAPNVGAPVEALDMLAIVRASQALSSETSLPQLQARVAELLGAMTGATQVQLILRRDDPAAWVLSGSDATGSAPVAMDDVDACNLLSLSAFNYAARTLEPLLVEDATRDDRFARDPYVAALERCSLLLVPILSKGKPRAMLVMENRLSRSAFSTERLDAVQLIAGQLAVSLENALLYQELEQRVAERTQELVNSFSLLNATLESSTDGIIAHRFGGGVICYNTQYKTMWGMPEELLQKGMGNTKRIEWVAAQTVDPEAFMERQLEIGARRETDAFEVIQLKDGRSIERVMKPQKIDGNTVGVVISFRDITERKRAEQEIEKIHRQLLDASRQAGMAEVASNVLHNVGNVLNSVNVSANLVAENMKRSKVSSLAKVAELLHQHQQDLAAFMTDDPKGKHLPGFLTQLTQHLLGEQQATIKELELLRNNIDHIKEIVAMQQSYSKVSGVKEVVNVVDLIEDTLNMNNGALQRHGVEIIREFTAAPLLLNTEKHKILQILVNLVRNAKYACSESGKADKRVTLRVTHNDEQIKIAVIDNGVGISADNLTRIFGHGFTTRKDGHGYGLHSSALAAQELGGAIRVHSDGLGQGACFTLELPFQSTESSHA